MEPKHDPTDEPLEVWQYRSIIKALLEQNKILKTELGEIVKRTNELEGDIRTINARLNSADLPI